MPPSSEPTGATLPRRQRKAAPSAVTMSLSAFSSAPLSISSLSDTSSSKKQHHKRKESFRGEIFVSSFEASSDGCSSVSSASSSANKSMRQQEVALPALLGDHNEDSATATGSSTGFPSLAHSGSSLSSNQTGPVLALTVSRASACLRDLNNREIKQEQPPPAAADADAARPDFYPWDSDNAHAGPLETSHQRQQPLVVLENVEYVASLPHASSCTDDLSTLDEPITKEMASDVFSRRIVPLEIIPTSRTDHSEDISTLYGGKHQQVQADDDDDDQEAHDIDVEQGGEAQAVVATSATAVEVQVSFPWYQPFLGRRSRIEVFFIAVIGVSSSILIVLLIVVLT